MAQRPGLKAVDMFEAMYRGRIKAVWIIATNPVVSLPNADRAREALRRCELVVVSDCVARTDTSVLAHVLLPAAAWGEKDGTVTNSDRHILAPTPFLPMPGARAPGLVDAVRSGKASRIRSWLRIRKRCADFRRARASEQHRQ